MKENAAALGKYVDDLTDAEERELRWDYLSKIVWTDEKIFTADGGRRQGYRTKKAGPCIRFSLGKYTEKRMCWGGVSLRHGILGPVWVVGGTENTAVYAEILRDHYCLAIPPGSILMQDNASPHNRCNVMEILRKPLIKDGVKIKEAVPESHLPIWLPKWPPQSPDLNPIEHLWSWLDEKKIKAGRVMSREEMCYHIECICLGENPFNPGVPVDELKKEIHDEVESIIMNWFERLQAVIDSDGERTRY